MLVRQETEIGGGPFGRGQGQQREGRVFTIGSSDSGQYRERVRVT